MNVALNFEAEGYFLNKIEILQKKSSKKWFIFKWISIAERIKKCKRMTQHSQQHGIISRVPSFCCRRNVSHPITFYHKPADAFERTDVIKCGGKNMSLTKRVKVIWQIAKWSSDPWLGNKVPRSYYNKLLRSVSSIIDKLFAKTMNILSLCMPKCRFNENGSIVTLVITRLQNENSSFWICQHLMWMNSKRCQRWKERKCCYQLVNFKTKLYGKPDLPSRQFL